MSALRFVAALWIVCYHLAAGGLLEGMGLPHALRTALRNGAPMTGLFIMMSGFMMYYAYTRPDGSLSCSSRRVWVGRVARIWPIMMLGHLLALPFAFLGSDTYSPIEAMARGIAVTAAMQGWIPQWAQSYNAPAWTLSVLAVCYALLPTIVRVLRERSTAQLIGALALCWIAMLVPTAVYFASLPTGFSPLSDAPYSRAELFLQAFPPFRIPEFVLGAILGRLFLLRSARPSAAVAMAGVGAGTATLIFLSLTPTLPSRFVANGMLAPLFCVLLIGVACLPESVDRLLVRARLTKLGDASLSVFILHMPFVVTFLALRHRGLLTDAVRMPLFAAFLVVMVASSAALESWFVQPMATRVKARLDRWLGPEVPLVLTPRRATPLEPVTGPSAARRGTRPAPRSTAA